MAGLSAATALLIAAGLAALGPDSAVASSHREAPLVAADPAIDNTDLYAFASPDRPGYLTIVANWIPFEEPNGGPNFYPFATDAAYNLYVDNDGDALPDATFRFTFHNVDKRGNNTFLYNNGPVTSLDDENLLFRQTYTLESSFNGAPFKTRIADAPVAPSRTGPASMPDYAKLRQQATLTLPGGWKTFAGQADDPFFLDLRVFDLLYGGNLSEVGQDTLSGYNVNSIALQVPFKDVALGGDVGRNPVIGVWTTTDRAKVRMTGDTSALRGQGDRVQVSRLGNPLVNEVVVPAALKDAFNALSPDKDASVQKVVDRVTDPEVPHLIEGIYGVPAPPTPRNDLAEIFLTGLTTKANGPIKVDLNSQLMNRDVRANRFRPSEMLRLNLSTPVTTNPKRLGVLDGDLQGFPNGRRLTDDVVDIELQALEGAAQTGKLVDALAAGDKVNANDNAFERSFPYLALPNVGAVNGGAVNGGGTGAGGAVPGDGHPGESASPTAMAAAGQTGPGESPVPTMAAASGAAGAAALLVGGAWWWRRRRSRPAAVATAGPAGAASGDPGHVHPHGPDPDSTLPF
ncbi:hypothetical protein Raf01_59050 [Rugosimonospora africana]|uniref:DUF4331 domain-containing protein n=1 Tax=Rugosimonospora africana TaxID=556532 RepID=A0A8J3QVQ9_9ACTN|nr:hypothetical protein Raf01_59050 [Rugosimonospora africana]